MSKLTGTARPPAARRAAFTLVELLVVIGIIALLMSILLPTLGRVKEQANSIKCGSNLRQLGLALTGYLNDNGGRFPAAAQGGALRSHDFFYWQDGREVNESALAPHLGRPLNTDHFVCPSDNMESHPGAYKYSYDMNLFMSNTFDAANIAGIATPQRDWFVANLKIANVRNPSDKIVFVEEHEATINDGLWAPIVVPGRTSVVDQLAGRHDLRNLPKDSPDARGNVAFSDGHVEYIARGEAHKPERLLPKASFGVATPTQ